MHDVNGPNGKPDRDLLRGSYLKWLKQRTIRERYRVKPGDRRTTPPPAYDVEKLFPELAGQSATTVRLHPRYGDEPPVDASKLGGTFLWPVEEPWPVCAAHETPLITVLQLRASDFPEMSFPPGADLFQLLWCPRDHFDFPELTEMPWPMDLVDPRFYWRNRQQVKRARPDNPPPQDADYEYVPLPCRLLPERVIEHPSVYDLPEELLQRISHLEDQRLGPDGVHAVAYEFELSVAYGTKVGGYRRCMHSGGTADCDCGRPMEHLLTVASAEWNGVGDPRWTPVEEQKVLASLPPYEMWQEEHRETYSALCYPTGLNLGDAGHMQLFLCRHCSDWPILAAIESH